ncbi:ADP-ribosylation/Crystallin J1 [Ilyonectria robusta]|uniref:ADP-ribosylation/Crystallin J1 n=1 Tax=Ilyonectria robusta TaxID=1079257 RepID=UPI001E8E1222|nr:ADP-ribosylation/Crystallin J1 [Ilyonectria robusta]KAH8734107.1 ADP-ribosylation/Crystallin J1 [Ilyonectria robusta]
MASSNDKTLSASESRVVGALLGVHAGDSLGATLEFKTHAQIASLYPTGLREIIGGGPFNWPAGHATDDTDMTRGVLLAYRDATPGDDVARLAGDYFLKWLDGDWPDRISGAPPEDMGMATGQGLEKFRWSRDPNRAGAGQGNAGNGSLMRCIPTGLFQSDPEKLIHESIRISKITHDDFRCTAACAVYNTIVSELVKGAIPGHAVMSGEAVALRLENNTAGEVCQAVRLGKEVKVADMAQRGPPPIMKGKCSGYVLESLTIAIAAALDERRLEDVLVDVVRIGKDTDTNAAIAGGVLGARDGEAGIPRDWKATLQFAQEFEDVALALMRR